MITKLKQVRKIFHLSEQYVANYLNIPWFNYILIEEGSIPISEPQIQKLNTLYGTKANELLSVPKEETDEDITKDLITFIKGE